MGSQKETTPKQYQINVSENALKNLNEITGYIAFINNQPRNAVKVGERLLETIERIGQHPYAFKECAEIATKAKIYRRAVCQSWLIVYKVIETDITIPGIIHISQKPSTVKGLRRIK